MFNTLRVVCMALLLFFFSCKGGSDDSIKISFDNIVVATANITYIESNCSFAGASYNGTYRYMQRSLNFNSMNGCNNVEASNIQLDNCSGSLTASCDGVEISCELISREDDSCFCSYEDDDTEQEKDLKDKITNGINTLLDKVNSAREYIFLDSDVCREEYDDLETSYICYCSQL